ncbi:MAG: DUF1501 domain-containing protein, partial [Planctomycetes bacterium]|nr:DUF1501 domain-containing protein [Planctomycetota bacterium]
MNESLTRRTFLGKTTQGLGAFALASMLDDSLLPGATDSRAREVEKWPGILTTLHMPARAKRVIHLCMAGGPSHLETLDYKPKLAALDGQPMPESFTEGQPIAQLQGKQLKCLAPQYTFS